MLKSVEMLSYVFSEKEYLFFQLLGPDSKPSKSYNSPSVDFDGLGINISYARYLESNSKNC